MAGTCPTTEQLAAALRGRQSSAAEAELAAHLVDCPACRARLEEMAGGSSWLETRAKAHAASAKSASEFLHKAMQALESRSPGLEAETVSPPQLDFLQPSDQPGVLGRFGPYEVLEQVAAGGMGIVLKARDPGLNRIVALKILPPALAANSLARARFIREARAAAAVVHEHVVPIYAVDEFAGLPYLVMQFIKGRPLSERIRATGPLQVEEILRIGAQTAAGLAAAHAQGLIHRDVKPGNILLENSVERVKITDFGLARAADDSSLTHDGHIAGTPEYMAPEQANNEPVDQRADLFSFGCVLYEMATGVSPFHAEKPLAALRRVCEENPPPAHTLNDRIPEGLGQLIQSLMAKNAASRPQTAAEVAEELGRRLAEFQYVSGSNHLVPELRPRAAASRRVLTQPVWLATLIVPLLLALVMIFATRPKSPPEMERLVPPDAQPSLPFVLLASGDGDERGFASLAEAVETAPAGAVIELRFNGPQAIPSVPRIEKALILRAAPGFKPVLTPANTGTPVLLTLAPLVLEGLTLITRPSPSGGRRPLRGQFGAVGISVEGGSILVAHCRFEIPSVDVPQRDWPESVRLEAVPSARFLYSEFSGQQGYGIVSATPRAVNANPGTNQLTLEGCTLYGNFFSRGGWSAVHGDLILNGNTFCGDRLLVVSGAVPDVPMKVSGANNVLSINQLIARMPPRAERVPLESLLHWVGSSNVYAVETAFADLNPRVAPYEEWLASGAVGETNSLSAELGIQTRLANVTNRTHAAEAAAFALTPEERQRLNALGWTSPEPPGANPQKTGPGRPYHEWRNSPAYQEWLKMVREYMPKSAGGQ